MCFSVLINKGYNEDVYSSPLPTLHSLLSSPDGTIWGFREDVSRCWSWNFALVMPTRYNCIPIYVDCTGSQNVYALALHQHTWSFRAPFKYVNLQRWYSMGYYVLYWKKPGAERQSPLHNEIEIITPNVPLEAGSIAINFQVRNKHNQKIAA